MALSSKVFLIALLYVHYSPLYSPQSGIQTARILPYKTREGGEGRERRGEEERRKRVRKKRRKREEKEEEEGEKK